MPDERALPSTPKPSTGLKELADAANEAAKREATQWFFLVTLLVYLAIAAGGTTPRRLLLGEPVTLPIFNVALPLTGFFVVAPAILVAVHFYLLAQLRVMAAKVAAFLDAAEAEADGNAAVLRLTLRRLDPFPVAQVHAAARLGEDALALRTMAVTTLVAAPLLLLLFVQVRFLAYQDVLVTAWHRALIMLDLVLLWRFLPAVLPVGTRLARPALAAATAALVLAIWTIPVHPEERGERFGGAAFERLRALLPRSIVLPDDDFVPLEGAALEAASRTVILRGRTLRGAVLTRADLRRADLTGADLSGADLSGADLRGAQLDGASLRAARLAGARLEAASLAGASLPGAVLDGARLQRATLDRAVFDGASFRGVNMRGASAVAARGIAAGFDGADLAAADFRDAILPAAIFTRADARGAVFAGAELSAADLAAARLDGAELDGARLWRARGPGRDVDGAEPTLDRPPGLDALFAGALPPLAPPARHQAVAERLAVLFRPAEPEEDKALLTSWRGPRSRQRPEQMLFTLICEYPYDASVVHGLVRSRRIGAMGWIADPDTTGLRAHRDCAAGRDMPEEDWEMIRRAVLAIRRAR